MRKPTAPKPTKRDQELASKIRDILDIYFHSDPFNNEPNPQFNNSLMPQTAIDRIVTVLEPYIGKKTYTVDVNMKVTSVIHVKANSREEALNEAEKIVKKRGLSSFIPQTKLIKEPFLSVSGEECNGKTILYRGPVKSIEED